MNKDIQDQINIISAQAELSEYKTNHILHLILTILTAGLWLIVWVIVASSNSTKRYSSMNTIKNGGKKSFSIGIGGMIFYIFLGVFLLGFISEAIN